MTLRLRLLPTVSALTCLCAGALADEGAEFFEKKIRPVLAAECYECHGAKKQKGGLRLDYRDGWRKGGDSGDAIVPGDAAGSLLIQAIRHDDPDLKMPAKAPKLDDAVIADFAKWVNMGAPDPRDAPPAGDASQPSWADALVARRGWWSLQPIRKFEPPPVKAWSANPADRFLLAKLEEKGLAPAADADPRTLIRRLTFALTGLPPTPEEVEAFVRASGSGLSTLNCPHKDPPRTSRGLESQLSTAADRLLASPRFGERFARHWMDLMRYAETHGSESDPEIPLAWRYRDYLIRAFNADVPLDQLIREHLAGDLLAQPRVNADGFNESILGTAHLRLVEHGFQPVDTLDDQVKAVDSQIDVVSKAFQALTISCARCHDHKFDAVSQRDYYALYGVFASCRPAQVTIDTAEVQTKNRAELEQLHGRIKAALAEAWTGAAGTLAARLQAEAGSATALSAEAMKDADKNAASPLHLWAKLGGKSDGEFAAAWSALAGAMRAKIEEARAFNRDNFRPVWNLAGGDYAKWFPAGAGLRLVSAGEFSIEPEGGRVLSGLHPAGALTHKLSEKHGGLLTSPRFKIGTDNISVRAFGGGGAMVRVIVDNYPLPTNPIFPKAALEKAEPGWVRLDTAYRKGSNAYIEFGTRDDLTRPLADKGRKADGHSFFGAGEIVAHDGKDVPRDESAALSPLLDGPAPKSAAELAMRCQSVLGEAVGAWREDRLNEPQRAWLDFMVRRGVLPAELPEARPLVAEYRRLEAEIARPRRAPGVIETQAYDAPLFARGDHLKPGELVPRAYLGVFGGRPFGQRESGRLELADAFTDPENPLTARVMVNRVWHWLFGRGLVPTVDNFGRLGDKPTHPELLDFLAGQFVEQGWSVKELVRALVATRAFQMSSDAMPRSREVDPGNEWLSHFRVRRLEAEAVRDELLAVAGELDRTMFGASADANAPRRSVYLAVRRTNLNPFLEVFDAPKPFSTLGRRDETNVPAQSLALLNSPFVVERARAWARRLLREADPSVESRVTRMFAEAFARTPNAGELLASVAFLNDLAREQGEPPDKLLTNERVWQDFAQSLFNLKEFIYLR